MDDEHYPPEERPLSGMSDGALVQAIATAEKTIASLEHVGRMLTGPCRDVDDPKGSNADAIHRTEQTLERLKWERKQRQKDTET